MTLPFPTTLDAFTACQARLMGEPVGDNLKEALAAWVPLFNACFEDGRRGDMAELVADVGRLDDLVELNADNTQLTCFLKAARVWMVYAWQQGRERSRTA